MKKILMTLLCTLMSVLAIAQIVMVIEKNDNTTIRISVDDVRRVFFDKGMVLEKNDNTTEKFNTDEVRRVYFETDDVVAVDSTYTLSGSGDEYIVEKKVTYSDKKTQTFSYSYTGRHKAWEDPFENVVTSNLMWKAGELQKGTQIEWTTEEVFSEVTKFSVVYTTTTWNSVATNGVESGTFAFRETVPTVKFIDGKVSKTFPARTYVITGKGAKLDTKSTSVTFAGVKYEAYTYEYTATAKFSNLPEETLVSSGRLFVKADGEPEYKATYSWNGDTYTAKVIKTIPHTNAEDEVQTFEKSVTVSLSDFDHIQVTADRANVNFQKLREKLSVSSATELPWTVKNYSTRYTYFDASEAINKQLIFSVNDAEIVFSDGAYQHTFDVRATVTTNERFGEPKVENGCEITPYYLMVTATIGKKTLTETYIVDISVKRYSSRTIVNPKEGTADCEITITNDDGSTEVFLASEAFGSQFAFDFSDVEVERDDEIVSNNNYQHSGSIGEAISSKEHQQGNWMVIERLYPYTIVFDNGVAADKVTISCTFKNYEFVFTHSRTGTVKLTVPEVKITYSSNLRYLGQDGDYLKYDWQLDLSVVVRAALGDYRFLKPVSFQVKYENVEVPNEPHLGIAKAFYVTAVYDPEAKVTKRAFISLWERGVAFAVCDFERTFPKSQDYKVCLDTYADYNSIGYDPNSAYHWRPARNEIAGNTLYWYRSDGTLMYSLTESECQAVGWKNVVNGKYAIEIPGYSYSIGYGGYRIWYVTPDDKKKTVFGDYIPSMVVTY